MFEEPGFHPSAQLDTKYRDLYIHRNVCKSLPRFVGEHRRPGNIRVNFGTLYSDIRKRITYTYMLYKWISV